MSKHRRDNSIKKSLHEIKKTLKSNNWDGKSKRNMECKTNSLNSFKFENPMCDSNKTKATCADSPAQTFPVEVEMVLSVYDNQLSKFEKIELSDYKQKNPHFKIYFLGDISTRKKNPDNEKFDNEEGYYRARKGSNIYFRYEVKSLLGKGSFGKVYLAHDHKEKIDVALKVLRVFPQDDTQIDLEPEILMNLKSQCLKASENLCDKNIIEIYEYFEFRLHKCMTMGIFKKNLYEKLNEHKMQGLELITIKEITLQMLE